MKAVIRHSLVSLVLLAVCLPAAFIATLLLSPLWSWIEATYGIESIGHSGPAEWCFYVVYGILGVAALFGYRLVVTR